MGYDRVTFWSSMVGIKSYNKLLKMQSSEDIARTLYEYSRFVAWHYDSGKQKTIEQVNHITELYIQLIFEHNVDAKTLMDYNVMRYYCEINDYNVKCMNYTIARIIIDNLENDFKCDDRLYYALRHIMYEDIPKNYTQYRNERIKLFCKLAHRRAKVIKYGIHKIRTYRDDC
jgi:hypothetical protein